MNIPAIKRLCVKSKRVSILNNRHSREQWISDGTAAWLVDQGIFVDEEQVVNCDVGTERTGAEKDDADQVEMEIPEGNE